MLSFANRDELVNNDMDVDRADNERLHDGWEDMDEEAGLYVPPPGEEGVIHSHGGGEDIFQQIFDSIHSQYVVFHFSFVFLIFLQNLYRKRGDPRTRMDRVQQRVNAWRQQLPLLVEAYLLWNSTKSDPRTSSTLPHPNSNWKIKVLDFYREHACK